MCKQKPGTQSESKRTVESNSDSSAASSTTPATMPSVGACYKGPADRKMAALSPTTDEHLFASAKVDKDLQSNSTGIDATTSATVDPWSPAISTDVVPDPYCPRRTKAKRCFSELPCGSEESLLPQSDSSCDGASAVACSSLGMDEDLDLIRFSPGALQMSEGDDLTIVENACIFSSDRVKFEDELSDGEEFEDAIDTFNLDPYPVRGNMDVMSFPSIYNRADVSLSREASDLFLDVILPKRLGLPQVKSAAEISVASSTISQKSMPICRICHLPATEEDRLMSPCRCSGTMRFIHSSCLMKWLEISSSRSKRPPSCELCLYQYHRHKKFKVRQWQFPQCSRQDKILHVIFIASLVIMLGCATATILCFKQDRGIRNSLEKSELTKSEVITLVCGVIFFVAFFVAMYVEVKSRNTIYKLCVKFIYLNQQWYIDEYDKRKDVQPVPV